MQIPSPKIFPLILDTPFMNAKPSHPKYPKFPSQKLHWDKTHCDEIQLPARAEKPLNTKKLPCAPLVRTAATNILKRNTFHAQPKCTLDGGIADLRKVVFGNRENGFRKVVFGNREIVFRKVVFGT